MPRAGAKRSIHINSAPEDVYDFALGDVSSLADWLTSVDKVEEVDPSWPAVGASYVYSREFRGRSSRGRTIILEAERPGRVVMREDLLLRDEAAPSDVSDDRVGRSIWTFEPERGGTLVTMDAVGVEMGTLMYVLWRLLVAGQVRKAVDSTLGSLKRICEEELEDAAGESS